MSDKNPNDNAYEIGYKRPPQSTRFKPGRSGNPKGRQKGSRNFATVLEAELNTRISVTENGVRKTISKREATAKHLVNKAATGLLPAVKLLLEQERQQENEQSPLSNAPRDLLPPDHLVLKSLYRRLMQMEATPAIAAADEVRSPQQRMEDAQADDVRSSRQQIAAASSSGSSTGADGLPRAFDPLCSPRQDSGRESD
ncbi:hypothetical protein SAMN05216386_0114 [Nitrosospira briensis]|uniref:DUF5681 domain-containing protein n=1 Tax=Nitrosospira briensis TaxID=35799 RepID=A0A1I4XHZ3_9PROT|nr:DUF5681 domain-containing protein [Nitrosospira briensis]SFN24879.1 hypothetical protein SAMN05216386_0114 [Nitrosospira briensis]